MEWRSPEAGALRVARSSCRILAYTLGLRDDPAPIISDVRLRERLADTRHTGVQPPAAQGMPAAAPRRRGRAALVRRELPGRLYLLRLRALAAANLADLQSPGSQAQEACQGLCRRRGVGSRRTRT